MKKLSRPVLAEGEVTGHAHVIDAEVEVFEKDDGTRIFENSQPVTVRHEEHGPVEVLPGKYISGKVVEFDHFEEDVRKVQD